MPGGHSSSLGVGQKPPLVPCHTSLSAGQLSACQFALNSKEEAGETVLYSLVTSEEVTSDQVCPILFIRTKLLGSAHPQKEEELHRVGISGGGDRGSRVRS